MADVPSRAWAEKVVELLDASPEFRRDGRGLSGSVYLFSDHGGVTLRFDRGTVVEVLEGVDSRGSRFLIGGTRQAWDGALANAVDLPAATGSPHGLVLEGDLLRVAGNAKAFMWLWLAMKGAAAH